MSGERNIRNDFDIKSTPGKKRYIIIENNVM